MDNPHSDINWLFYKDLEDLYRGEDDPGLANWLMDNLKVGEATPKWSIVLLREDYGF